MIKHGYTKGFMDIISDYLNVLNMKVNDRQNLENDIEKYIYDIIKDTTW